MNGLHVHPLQESLATAKWAAAIEALISPIFSYGIKL